LARLSTHVLDISRGQPAGNLTLDLYFWNNGQPRHIKTAVTNGDGRTEEPLLSGSHLQTGIYEIIFHAGDYFRAVGPELPDPPFLDDIVIRFGISDPSGNYHVPLLCSPYGYSTYRGS